MTKAASKPSWLPPISLAVIAIMVGVGSIGWHFVPLRITGQALLIVVILRAFYVWPPVTRLIAAMPVVHRIVFLALILAMIAGHYTLNGRTYFPFVTWSIFPNPASGDPVICNEFVATTMAGHKVRLLAEQLFPSIVQIDRVENFDDTTYYPPDTTEHLARALAKMYNEQHPADPVWRVDLMRLAVALHPPDTESRANPSCELLKQFDISSGP